MAEPTDTPTDTPTGGPDAPAGRPWWRGPGGVAALLGAIVLLVAGVLLALSSADGDEGAGGTATSTTRRDGAGGPDGTGASGPSGASGASGRTGSGGTGKGGRGSTTTTTTPPATVETTPDVEADLARIRVAITPGTCLWNADTLDLTARGTIRNDNPVDAVVSIDVTFLDGTGAEVDFASELAILNPGEQAPWDVLGASIDPPNGGLRCEVALS
jgi:hypothetical protein